MFLPPPFKDNALTQISFAPSRLGFVLLCFVFGRAVPCRILVPQPGIEPRSWQGKRQVLTTGLPGNS